ncbi:hypothetical protein CDD82_1967 [Ophiocordyceps australis]|uniref:GTP cyclohydrolase N-terminal domain-containing protein n=1 Tax=Ophiocordyceps australis TaxID=1399860 RepID=A0A2C5Y5R3_9HYPO|nr:hypothetical protein CDD82_1967 [Ophiocordyceps australis]
MDQQQDISRNELVGALDDIQRSQRQLLAAIESISERLTATEPTARPVPHGTEGEDSSSPMGDPQHPQQAPRPGFRRESYSPLIPGKSASNHSRWTGATPTRRDEVPSWSRELQRPYGVGMHLSTDQSFSGGSYSVYYALALASKELNLGHRPDFTNTEPAVQIGPFPQWAHRSKIIAMDPWGHLAPWIFSEIMERDKIDIRPTIAITKAHMKLPELEGSVKNGRLVPDGKVCLNELGELAVTKFAVEPVWYLPGVAERFGIDEGTLRRSLFEHTGGSYPELITRSDIKVFLPPIGGLTVYCFGDPSRMSDSSVRLSLRIHDECNGSDVFGSDILVYNARKRGADRASEYFTRTENIAGVKDMRFQALMPDILHWLGIKKIDRMLSMSNMKYDAIVNQGIPIHERVELPQEMIPTDSRVEIDAKITAGYFTTGKRLTAEELQLVQGRIWEE